MSLIFEALKKGTATTTPLEGAGAPPDRDRADRLPSQGLVSAQSLQRSILWAGGGAALALLVALVIVARPNPPPPTSATPAVAVATPQLAASAAPQQLAGGGPAAVAAVVSAPSALTATPTPPAPTMARSASAPTPPSTAASAPAPAPASSVARASASSAADTAVASTPTAVASAVSAAGPASAPESGAEAKAAVRPTGGLHVQISSEAGQFNLRETFQNFLRQVQLGQLSEAQRFADQISSAVGSSHVMSLRAQGYIALQKNEMVQAKIQYLQLQQLLPDDREAGVNLALIDWRQGDRDSASRRIARLVEKFPNDPEVRELYLNIRAP